jgi:hypothetical protein
MTVWFGLRLAAGASLGAGLDPGHERGDGDDDAMTPMVA